MEQEHATRRGPQNGSGRASPVFDAVLAAADATWGRNLRPALRDDMLGILKLRLGASGAPPPRASSSNEDRRHLPLFFIDDEERILSYALFVPLPDPTLDLTRCLDDWWRRMVAWVAMQYDTLIEAADTLAAGNEWRPAAAGPQRARNRLTSESYAQIVDVFETLLRWQQDLDAARGGVCTSETQGDQDEA